MSCLDDHLRAEISCPEDGQSVPNHTANIISCYFNRKLVISQEVKEVESKQPSTLGGRPHRMQLGSLVMS
jgi:hypothetical protein